MLVGRQMGSGESRGETATAHLSMPGCSMCNPKNVGVKRHYLRGEGRMQELKTGMPSQGKTDMSDTTLETVRSQSDLGGTSAVRAWGIPWTILPLYLL